MNKYLKVQLVLLLGWLLAGCFMYSFSGNSLSKDATTFSIQDFQSKVGLGPSDLSEQITQKLRNELIQKTSLKEVVSNGDLQFQGIITEFKYTPITPRSNAQGEVTSRTQLIITVQVNYSNVYNSDFEFSKKPFTQSTDIDATANLDTEEDGMVKEVLKKLIQDIFTASVASW